MARAKGIPALELYRLAQKKKRKLVLCGHSLGGAVSIFLHFIVILTIWFLFICFFFCCGITNFTICLIVGGSIGHASHFEGYCRFFPIERQ